MILTIIETPYRGNTKRNIRFARRCLCDSLSRGEAPLASHLLYTQEDVLRDWLARERLLGIQAGLAWLQVAQRHVFYTDLGWSEGMREALRASSQYHTKVYIRGLQIAPQTPPKELLATISQSLEIVCDDPQRWLSFAKEQPNDLSS